MRHKEKGPRPEKVQEVEELREILQGSKAAIIADYRGLNVKTISTLRKRLRDSDSSMRVVKNTLLKRASEGLPAENLVKDLEGPTALAYSLSDPVSVAKVLTGFVREFKILTIKGGVAEGQVMGPTQIQALSTMPAREVLIAQVVGGLQAPVSSLVGTMQQIYAGLVYTLQGVADKKGA
ncbi:MAG TPA: 50S ribosomal protein L10 [Armatimonadota bacterium]|jgi:large subunit ribosomal protein L10|nr:50S ribosomal protein L10 [Armatimonadota bacterium]HOM71926.1 50S ribosomal protein L10 [Armatimonadota bacterium]HOP78945.1 50S ribosomal protein L10 [Armatimonadota bacterium]HPP74980.1 50S ribosomal protein L10 [Armatimonadota bacterium]